MTTWLSTDHDTEQWKILQEELASNLNSVLEQISLLLKEKSLRILSSGEIYIKKGWKDVKDMKEGTVTKTYIDDTLPGGPREKTITYHAPFDRCDREEDYRTAWKRL